jgi:aminoglycoside phosphotransferase (APT) family kinase protein
LSFVPGVAVHPDHLHLITTLSGLRVATQLIVDYHDAQQTFQPPRDAIWRDNGRDPSGSEEVLAHNDFAPWNLIVGDTWTYIDWDLLAPGRRYWDLSWALHSLVGLWPEAGLSDTDVVRRINAFCDTAAISLDERPGLLQVVVERTAHCAAELRRRSDAGEPAYRRMVEDGHADGWESGSRYVAENLDRWSYLIEQ